MGWRTLKQNPKNYPDLPVSGIEPDTMEAAHLLTGVKYTDKGVAINTKKNVAGSKRARHSSGTERYGETNPVYRGNCAFAIHRKFSDKGKQISAVEVDVRPLNPKDVGERERQKKVKLKEKIDFKFKIICKRVGTIRHKEDKAVVLRIVEGVITGELDKDTLASNNPYTAPIYERAWNYWATLIQNMDIKLS